MPTAKQIDQSIQKHLAKLRKPGVLTVRPGYEIAGHQLTGKPAIVATVHTKKAVLPRGERLPDNLDNMPVDVREATAHQRLRAHDPAAAELAQTYGRPEDTEPAWDFEREMPSGKLLKDSGSDTQKALASRKARQPATTRALTAHSSKPALKYAPPAGATLDPVTASMTITAHASPDAGLATLDQFLAGTTRSLVIGMYDFTSGHILKTFDSALGGHKTLQMVLDNPAPNPTRDQTDTQTVEELDRTLGARATITRALVRSDPFASAWIFPYAYHIKVIVRDDAVVWLSSGNLNNSNQPDLAAPPHTEDRDWHVIIEHAGLAATFTAYLTQDYKVASQHQANQPADAALDRAVADAHAKVAAEANPPPPPPLAPPPARYVPAKTFSGQFKVTPLLTPDLMPGSATQGQYLSHVMDLIGSAKQKLYIQLQYIEASSGTGDYDALLKAIAARAAANVDVRLIESLEYGEKWIEKMKSAGVDLTAHIRLQPNVHNKGFVVDSRTVIVSSQNFSPAGVQQNRDAGVIMESAEIAAYFEAIFLSDWNTRAKDAAATASPRSSARARGGAAGRKTAPSKQARKQTAKKKTVKKKTAKKTGR